MTSQFTVHGRKNIENMFVFCKSKTPDVCTCRYSDTYCDPALVPRPFYLKYMSLSVIKVSRRQEYTPVNSVTHPSNMLEILCIKYTLFTSILTLSLCEW